MSVFLFFNSVAGKQGHGVSHRITLNTIKVDDSIVLICLAQVVIQETYIRRLVFKLVVND